MAEQKSQVDIIAADIKRELSSPEVARALLSTTFKGLSEVSMRQAMMEGMIRGFTFKDFLEKNVYAIPFGKTGGYSLITSIDYARKIGAKSGIVGKKAPIYEMGEEKIIISCTVTVQKKVGEYVGDFTATVFFDEYYKTNQYKTSLWDTKPRTMIAKVAEMHALRMACPEELSQSYIEEELEQEAVRATSRMAEAAAKVEESNITMGKYGKKQSGENAEEITVEKDKDAYSDVGEQGQD